MKRSHDQSTPTYTSHARASMSAHVSPPFNHAASLRLDELLLEIARFTPLHPATAAARIEKQLIERYMIPMCCPQARRTV